MIRLLSLIVGRRLAPVALAILLTFVATSSVSGLPLASPGADFTLTLEPASGTVAQGDIIIARIMINASSGEPVDAATAHLTYNADVLQVVDSGGNESFTIEKGLILTDNVWKFEIKNEVTVTGSSGQILFQAAKNDGADLGSDAISPFELAVIRFKGLAPSAGTPLTFVTTGVTITQARLGESNVTGTLTGATITVASDCTPPAEGTWTITQDCTVQGEVNPPGDVIVDTDVTVTVGSSGTLNVNFATNNLRIKNGAKVVIKDGGKID